MTIVTLLAVGLGATASMTAGPVSFAARMPADSKPSHQRLTWRVRIPAISVSAAIMASGVNRDGTIAVPPLADVQKVGWYEYGAVPGRPGPAILMGHVDTLAGRAVFYRLYQVRRGERIDIEEGGAPLVFAVTSIRQVSKRSFPASVYALTGPPMLYLVTCAGPFDYATRHYADNIIVTARLVAPPPARKAARRIPAPGIWPGPYLELGKRHISNAHRRVKTGMGIPANTPRSAKSSHSRPASGP